MKAHCPPASSYHNANNLERPPSCQQASVSECLDRFLDLHVLLPLFAIKKVGSHPEHPCPATAAIEIYSIAFDWNIMQPNHHLASGHKGRCPGDWQKNRLGFLALFFTTYRRWGAQHVPSSATPSSPSPECLLPTTRGGHHPTPYTVP